METRDIHHFVQAAFERRAPHCHKMAGNSSSSQGGGREFCARYRVCHLASSPRFRGPRKGPRRYLRSVEVILSGCAEGIDPSGDIVFAEHRRCLIIRNRRPRGIGNAPAFALAPDRLGHGRTFQETKWKHRAFRDASRGA